MVFVYIRTSFSWRFISRIKNNELYSIVSLEMAFLAAPAAAQTAQVVVQNADKVGHVASVGVARVLQGIIIFICVILILIGIIVMRYGSWVTGGIWMAIGVVGLAGTAWWARDTSSFLTSQPQPQYQVKFQPQYQMRRPTYPLPARPPAKYARGEEAEDRSDSALAKLSQVGGDCGCGDSEKRDESVDEAAGLAVSREDNIVPTPAADKAAMAGPPPVMGSGETHELFHEEMLEPGNATRFAEGKKLKLKAQ